MKSDLTLKQILNEIENAGIFHRQAFEVIPPKVEYSLTEEGQKLLPVMKLMEEWGDKFALNEKLHEQSE